MRNFKPEEGSNAMKNSFGLIIFLFFCFASKSHVCALLISWTDFKISSIKRSLLQTHSVHCTNYYFSSISLNGFFLPKGINLKHHI